VGARPRITAAGRRRVEAALGRTGLLLVQGQAEIPSVADLLAGVPVTTRGYSWDYVPAWNLTDEYEQADDVAVAKLFRGRRTLVHRRLWPAVDALAIAAREQVLARPVRTDVRRFVVLVEQRAGVPMGELREELRLERRAFDRAKRDLEQWLCVYGRERDDVEHHTHEPAFFPWSSGDIGRARGRRRPLAVDAATATLLAAVGTNAAGPAARLFPVLRAGGSSRRG
jgi:hypothetical protein